MEIISVYVSNDTIKLKRNINGKVDYLKPSQSVYTALDEKLKKQKAEEVVLSYDEDYVKIIYNSGIILEINDMTAVIETLSLVESKRKALHIRKSFLDEIINTITKQNLLDSDNKVTRKNTVMFKTAISISAAAIIAFSCAEIIPENDNTYTSEAETAISYFYDEDKTVDIPPSEETTRALESETTKAQLTTSPDSVTSETQSQEKVESSTTAVTTTEEPTTEKVVTTTEETTEEKKINRAVNVDPDKLYYCTDAYGNNYEFYIAKSGNSYNYTQSDVNHLALALYHEARGEDRIVTFFVGTVVLNRVKSSSFPNTVDGVLSQRGQYAWYPSRGFSSSGLSEPKAYERCKEIASELLEGYVVYDASTGKPFLPESAVFQAGFVQGQVCYAADTDYGNEYFCR